MLERLVKKYREQEIEGVVYRLSFGGAFIIVKARYLSGSLKMIDDDLNMFMANPETLRRSIYEPFCRWVAEYKGVKARSRFTIRIFAKLDKSVTHLDLLKTEERELMKNRNNFACLNENKYAHIPVWKEKERKFGWLDREAVLAFSKWTQSKAYKKMEERYREKVQ